MNINRDDHNILQGKPIFTMLTMALSRVDDTHKLTLHWYSVIEFPNGGNELTNTSANNTEWMEGKTNVELQLSQFLHEVCRKITPDFIILVPSLYYNHLVGPSIRPLHFSVTYFLELLYEGKYPDMYMTCIVSALSTFFAFLLLVSRTT